MNDDFTKPKHKFHSLVRVLKLLGLPIFLAGFILEIYNYFHHINIVGPGILTSLGFFLQFFGDQIQDYYKDQY